MSLRWASRSMRSAACAALLGCAGGARSAADGAAPGSRFLALGDSYTIGEGVAPAERWPAQFAVLLRAHGVQVGDPQIGARTGWTTGELSAGIDQADLRPPFALVTLLVGVNDQFRGRPVDEYRANLRALLRRAVAFAGGDAGRVVVLSIPDWGATPFAAGRDRASIAREIDAFNAVGRAEARAAGAAYVDVTAESRRDSADPAFVGPDGLHPSARMYGEWAKLALPAALAAVRAGG
jgi:lysophospholipase L1-like esterase